MWHQIIGFLLSFSPLRKPSKDGLVIDCTSFKWMSGKPVLYLTIMKNASHAIRIKSKRRNFKKHAFVLMHENM